MKSSLEIAQQHQLIPIEEIAERIGLLPDELEPYGRHKAKVSLSVRDPLKDAADAVRSAVRVAPARRSGS